MGNTLNLEALNPQQRKAVEELDSPVLVLAGAGSGKTRVLTYKIAYLLERKIAKPWEVLAVTFTNKAAKEMNKRVESLIGIPVSGMWMGTFHSVCARLLRIEGELLNFTSNFTIYDTDDQQRLVKQMLEKLGIDAKILPPRKVQYIISENKNKLIDAKKFQQQAADFQQKKIAEVYRAYQNALRSNNAMDFDDLLLNTLEILTRFPRVLEKYQQKFSYILVDEYQDTNKAQYYLIKQLSAAHERICVVGDEDQSIYRWRGADIENILSFEKDFPNYQVVRLEQNYRSTQTILDAANAVVSNNKRRLGKNLWSEKESGEQIQVYQEIDETGEASRIAEIIRGLMRKHDYSYNDFAILYRTNAQSRALEEKLRRSAIPYVLVGGTKFYERKEIKDILAYLRILVNPRDAIALRRIVNFPSRGIGNVSLAKLGAYAEEKQISLFEALQQAAKVPGISVKAQQTLLDFVQTIENLSAACEGQSAYQIADQVIDIFGLKRLYQQTSLPEDESRLENITELQNSLAVFVESGEADTTSLGHYLEGVALLTDIDRWDPSQAAVTLMTLHSAKGLEFPVVIIAGMEDGLFPLFRSLERDEDLEEERRLFYVGMTRAESHLYVTWASQRRRFSGDGSGMSYRNLPSRFLREIPGKFMKDSRIESLSSRTHRQHPPQTRARRRALSQNLVESGPYKIGTKVRHASFGEGQILGMEGSGVGLKLSVVFGRAIKKLVAEYANLEIID